MEKQTVRFTCSGYSLRSAAVVVQIILCTVPYIYIYIPIVIQRRQAYPTCVKAHFVKEKKKLALVVYNTEFNCQTRTAAT